MANGEVKNRYPAVAVGTFNINPGDPDSGKAPQIEVEMRGLDNEAGKQFWLYLSLHENAAEYSGRTLRDLGWKCNDITKLEGLGSTRVDIVEKEEVYKGKKRPKYMVFAPRGPRASLREEDQQSFASKFKALAALAKPAEVTEFNAAPADLPEVRAKAGSNGAETTSGDADPSSMYG